MTRYRVQLTREAEEDLLRLYDFPIERELADLLQCAPGAVAATKKLIAYVHSHDLDTNMIYAADKLADAWETEEGREGIAAFFGKRLPAWRQA